MKSHNSASSGPPQKNGVCNGKTCHPLKDLSREKSLNLITPSSWLRFFARSVPAISVASDFKMPGIIFCDRICWSTFCWPGHRPFRRQSHRLQPCRQLAKKCVHISLSFNYSIFFYPLGGAGCGLRLRPPKILANLFHCLIAPFRLFMLTQPQMGDRHSFPRRPAQYISGCAMLKLF